MVAMELMGKVWDQIHTQLLIGSLHKRGMQKGFKQDLLKDFDRIVIRLVYILFT